MGGDVHVSGDAIVGALVRTLIGIEVGLVVGDFLFAYLDLVPMKVIQHLANVTREDGVATWFASTQAFVVAAVLGALAWVDRRSARGSGLGFLVLAALFAWIAMDDALGIHERIGSAARKAAVGGSLGGFPTYYWQLVFAPVFGGGALFMLVFLGRRLATPRLRGVFGLALGCFVVAVGMDALEGVDGLFDSIAKALVVKEYTVSHYAKVTEEFLEMAGTTTFLALFVAQLSHAMEGWQLRFGR